jgi:hypothetical protein
MGCLLERQVSSSSKSQLRLLCSLSKVRRCQLLFRAANHCLRAARHAPTEPVMSKFFTGLD